MFVRWHFHKPVGCLPSLLSRARHRRLERLSPPQTRRQTRRRWDDDTTVRADCYIVARIEKIHRFMDGKRDENEKKVSFTPAAAMSSLVDFEHEITFLSTSFRIVSTTTCFCFLGNMRLWHVGGFWLIAFFALGDNDRVWAVPVRMPKNAPLALSVRRQMHQSIHMTIARCRTVV